MKKLEFKWTVSRARETEGYNICTLWVDGKKVAACNGGGYDMKGTVLGDYIAEAYPDRLLKLVEAGMPEHKHFERAENPKHRNDGKVVNDGRYFSGLSFHDPNFDPGKAVIGTDCMDRTFDKDTGRNVGKTVEEAEAANESLGLERYQAFYVASSKVPTERHTVPLIDGGCGFRSVEDIMKAVGLSVRYVPPKVRKRSEGDSTYMLVDEREKESEAA